MRLLIVCVCFCFLQSFSSVMGQITIKFNNVELDQALAKIEKETNYRFVYNSQAGVLNKKINFNFENVSINTIMDSLLKNTNFTYKKVNENLYAIVEKKIAIDVVGKVVDESYNPLVGASITKKGTKKGVISGTGGAFSLKGVNEGEQIEVSMVGYKTQTLSAVANMTIVMVKEQAVLEDVVVTGFQKVSKSKFSGASLKLKMDDMKVDGIPDVSRLLEGRAAGVSIQNVSSTFGSAPKVRIRGATSLLGSNKPLWVIDGVILEDVINVSNEALSSGDAETLLGSSVAGLNASDVESIDVLKDAAAAALYGARAMNGVIVITTKRGKTGKLKISYDGNFSTQLKPSYNSFNILNSAQQMDVFAELESKGLLNSDLMSQSNYGVYGKMYSKIFADANGQFGVENTPEGRRNFLLRYAKANTDWFKLLFRNNLIQDHNISFSFGGDGNQTYASLGLYTDNGWTLADKVSRYTINIKNTFTVNKNLQINIGTTGSYRDQRAPGTIGRITNSVDGTYDRDFDINPFSYAINTSRTMTAYDENGQLENFRRFFAPFNIINEINNNYIKLNQLDLKLQVDLSLKFLKNFSWDFMGAVRTVKSSKEHYILENSNFANAYRAMDNSVIANANKFLYVDPSAPDRNPVSVLPQGGFYNTNDYVLLNYTFRNTIKFSKTINDNNSVDALIGQEVKYSDRKETETTRPGIQYSLGSTPFVDYRFIKKMLESNLDYYGYGISYDRYAGFYSNLGYTFKKKYNLTLYGRLDGSNAFGKSALARWLPTWTLSGIWNFDKEPFVKKLKFLTSGKLRLSYGLTADNGPAVNSSVYIRSQSSVRLNTEDKETQLYVATLENRNLTWEKLYSGNVGLDLAFLKNRLQIVIDMYKRKSFSLIAWFKTSGIGGQTSKLANCADMTSQGLEGSINGTIIKGKKFTWNSSFNFGYTKTNITHLGYVPTIYSIMKPEGGFIEGYSNNSLFSIKYDKLDHTTGIPTFFDKLGQPTSSVSFSSNDLGYLKYSGTVDPPFTCGLANNFTYLDFTLTTLLSGQFGNIIRLAPVFKNAYTDFDALPKEFYDRWVLAGDETQTNIPSIVDLYTLKTALTGAYPYSLYNYSENRVAKGDFIRLKNITLSYNLSNRKWVKNAKLTRASVQISATNMALLYYDKKLKGQDPEFFAAGGVAQPLQKQFSLALKLGL